MNSREQKCKCTFDSAANIQCTWLNKVDDWLLKAESLGSEGLRKEAWSNNAWGVLPPVVDLWIAWSGGNEYSWLHGVRINNPLGSSISHLNKLKRQRKWCLRAQSLASFFKHRGYTDHKIETWYNGKKTRGIDTGWTVEDGAETLKSDAGKEDETERTRLPPN